MQYLVEGARGPLPASPEQALALLEGTVIPHFEHVTRPKAEGKILAGGVSVGDRAFVFIIEAASNDEADRIVRDMPAWGLLEWKGNPAAKRRGSRRDGAESRAGIEVCPLTGLFLVTTGGFGDETGRHLR